MQEVSLCYLKYKRYLSYKQFIDKCPWNSAINTQRALKSDKSFNSSI